MNAFTSKFSSPVIDGESIETEPDENGVFYRATIEHDDCMGLPWEEHDGHGIVRLVSYYDREDKHSGERLLYRGDRNEYTAWYDWAATIKKAKKDGWGCSKHEHKTKGEKAACAVQQDFDYLEAFLNDRWHWVSSTVQAYKTCEMGEEHPIPDKFSCLGGMDSLNEGDYLTEVANELLEELKEY